MSFLDDAFSCESICGSKHSTILKVVSQHGAVAALKMYHAVGNEAYRREVSAYDQIGFHQRIVRFNRSLDAAQLARVLENTKPIPSPRADDRGAASVHTGPVEGFEMELAHINSLELLKRQQRLPESWLREAGLSIASALQHCHASGVAHRDVKPDNVLVFRSSSGEVCPAFKLCDFGSASIFSSKKASGNWLRVTSSRPIGTGFYCAPEVVSVALNGRTQSGALPESGTMSSAAAGCAGTAHSQRSAENSDAMKAAPFRSQKRAARYAVMPVDVWSFGITMFVLGTGRLPFKRACSSEERYSAFLRATAQAPECALSPGAPNVCDLHWMWPSYLSRDCVSLIAQCLQADPARRPTFGELLQHPFLQPPEAAGPPGVAAGGHAAHARKDSSARSSAGHHAPMSGTPVRTSGTVESHPSLPAQAANHSWSTAPGQINTGGAAASMLAVGRGAVAGRRGSLRSARGGAALAAEGGTRVRPSPLTGARLAFAADAQDPQPCEPESDKRDSSSPLDGWLDGVSRKKSVTRERSQSFHQSAAMTPTAPAAAHARGMQVRPRSRSDVPRQNAQHSVSAAAEGKGNRGSGSSASAALSPEDEDAVGFVVRSGARRTHAAEQRTTVRVVESSPRLRPQGSDFAAPPSPLQPARLGRLPRRGSGVMWSAGDTFTPDDGGAAGDMQPLVLPSLDGDSDVAESVWSSAFSSHAGTSMSAHTGGGSFLRQASGGSAATSASGSRMSWNGALALQAGPSHTHGSSGAGTGQRDYSQAGSSVPSHGSGLDSPFASGTKSERATGGQGGSRKLALSGLGVLQRFPATPVGPPTTARGQGQELPSTPRLHMSVNLTDNELFPARGDGAEGVAGAQASSNAPDERSARSDHDCQPIARLTGEVAPLRAHTGEADDSDAATVSIETHAASVGMR